MMSAILFFFGATLIYTGFLALGRDVTVGLAVALAGLVLVVKPALETLKYLKAHFAAVPSARGLQKEPKERTRKTHLRVVKPEDEDRPTIH